MVRLKQKSMNKINLCNLHRSQFHYGSIKTLKMSIIVKPKTIMSQFHYSSIKTIGSEKARELFTKASQFHYGSIKTIADFTKTVIFFY